jgi:hypothetical protein
LNLKVAAQGSCGGAFADLRSPSFSTYQGVTESISRTRMRKLGAGMENSADFRLEYHLALGGRSVSNMQCLWTQNDTHKQV